MKLSEIKIDGVPTKSILTVTEEEAKDLYEALLEHKRAKWNKTLTQCGTVEVVTSLYS